MVPRAQVCPIRRRHSPPIASRSERGWTRAPTTRPARVVGTPARAEPGPPCCVRSCRRASTQQEGPRRAQPEASTAGRNTTDRDGGAAPISAPTSAGDSSSNRPAPPSWSVATRPVVLALGSGRPGPSRSVLARRAPRGRGSRTARFDPRDAIWIQECSSRRAGGSGAGRPTRSAGVPVTTSMMPSLSLPVQTARNGNTTQALTPSAYRAARRAGVAPAERSGGSRRLVFWGRIVTLQ